jgi:hypothetical protein
VGFGTETGSSSPSTISSLDSKLHVSVSPATRAEKACAFARLAIVTLS